MATAPNSLVPNAMLAKWYSGLAPKNTDETYIDATGSVNGAPNGGLLANGSVLGTKFLTGALNFANAAAFNAATTTPLTGVAATATSDFAFLWSGSFTAVRPGTYTFGLGQLGTGVAGEMSMLIDLNNDGFYDTATEKSRRYR